MLTFTPLHSILLASCDGHPYRLGDTYMHLSRHLLGDK